MMRAVTLAIAIAAAPAQAQQAGWVLEERLEPEASSSTLFGEFGDSVDLDGDRALVGAPSQEAAFVFDRQGNAWSEPVQLLPGFQGLATRFGEAVGISGERAAVGAPAETNGTGAVYVFVRIGTSWVEEQRLDFATGAPLSGFGSSLALEGDTLLVGAPAADRTFVYARTGAGWQPQQVLQVLPGDQLGRSLALAGDVAVVGAPGTDLAGTPSAGTAYVYELAGGSWSMVAELARGGSPAPGDRFGFRVGTDGELAVAGSEFLDEESGGVWVFERAAGWAQSGQLIADSNRQLDRFGGALAVSGGRIAVGAWGDDHVSCVSGGANEGTVYVFAQSGGQWIKQAAIRSGDASFNERFGAALALEGTTLLVGTPYDDPPVGPAWNLEGMAYDPVSGTLFGSDTWSGELVSVDPVSGIPQGIGPIGFPEVRGLAWDSATGTLYGSDVATDQLVWIDPFTGAGAPVGPLGFGNVEGLGFDPVSGVLYGLDRPCDPEGVARLLTIDPRSGAATLLTELNTLVGGYRALAVEPASGRLFTATLDDPISPGFSAFLEIDPATGQVSTGFGLPLEGIRGLAPAPEPTRLVSALHGSGRLWSFETTQGGASSPQLVDESQALALDPGTGTLYAVERDLDELVTLDTTTAGRSVVGPTGFDRIDALAFDPLAGVLYGADTSTDELVAIDPATGAGTAIGALGYDRVKGLAFDPAGRTLYGVDIATDLLLRIDPASGAATAIGPTGTLELRSLAFDASSGTLYGHDWPDLVVLDTATGAASVVAQVFGDVEGLAFDPATGRLFGVHEELLEIDPATGSLQTVDLRVQGAVHVLRLDATASYCTAGTSASGCQALLSAEGAPSASAPSGFALQAAGVEGQKDGLFFFGTSGRQAAPWGNGTSYQCVAPPVQRAGLLPGAGTQGLCDGAFLQDLNALWCPACPKPGTNPGAGATVQAQLWYRDPLNTSNQTTSLSNALEFTLAP